ncbi:TPA: stage III sporulation protein AE, partial [Clostridioides difficile]|nr:stage III sporulation protein AE [Clostridioides difficile]
MKKRFLPMIIGFLFTFFFVNIFAIMIFANEVPSSEDKEYGETKNSIDKYIDGQLDKLDINEIQDYINKEIVINDVNLKSFVKDLISGEKNILDLFNKDGLKILMFDEFKASLKVVAVILVLALLSSILKSLENSFSSGAVSQIATYIIFITMVSLTLIGFKDVLQICYDAIDHTVGLMQVIMPILITFLLLIGFPITSTTLNPIFIGGVTFINV